VGIHCLYIERQTKMEDKRERRKMSALHQPDLPCSYCDRPCHSAIGRVSHEHACQAHLAEMIQQIPEILGRYLPTVYKDEKSHIHIYRTTEHRGRW
jgi:hypothetical protein